MKWYSINKEQKVVTATVDVNLEVRLALRAITKLWQAPEWGKPEKSQRLLWIINDLTYGDAKDVVEIIEEIDDIKFLNL